MANKSLSMPESLNACAPRDEKNLRGSRTRYADDMTWFWLLCRGMCSKWQPLLFSSAFAYDALGTSEEPKWLTVYYNSTTITFIAAACCDNCL